MRANSVSGGGTAGRGRRVEEELLCCRVFMRICSCDSPWVITYAHLGVATSLTVSETLYRVHRICGASSKNGCEQSQCGEEWRWTDVMIPVTSRCYNTRMQFQDLSQVNKTY